MIRVGKFILIDSWITDGAMDILQLNVVEATFLLIND